MHETELILNVSGFPPGSARNCHQELYPILNGEFKKSINGDLLFLETSEQKRYKSVISCTDRSSPIMDGIWIGSHVSVGCIQSLWQMISPSKTKVSLIRPAVSGSVCAVNPSGKPVRFRLTDNEVHLYNTCKEQVLVCFRPWLSMLIVDFSLETDEWNMSSVWKLVLEEV